MECLTPDQKSAYEANGYLLVENRIPDDWLTKIRTEIARFEAEAATMTDSNDRLDLEDSHTPDDPRLRRIKLPHAISDIFRDLMLSDHVLAPARDLIGPNLRLHTSKLNMKSAGYGAAVEWHQDYAFYPHTNDDILAIGVVLLALAALFQLVDGGQVVALGLLRGVQDTRVPMVLAAVSYWAIGIPCSYILGFVVGWEGAGIWLGLVVGLANEQSIAWGCVKAFHDFGAELAITYLNEKTRTYTEPLMSQIKAPLYLPLNVTNKSQMDAVFSAIDKQLGGLDFILHSIAFAPREDLQGRVLDCSSSGFQTAMDISVHSLIRLANCAESLMKDGGSIITMSYYGAEKVIDNYNMMGPVKAALEATTRYIAAELGPSNIRVNALSPGPVMTRAASGLSHFDALMEKAAKESPLHSLVSIEQIGEAAAFLVSDKSRHITGQTIYVDNGYNTLG